MITEFLIDIGLSTKEARMYLALLRHGAQPTSYIAKRAGYSRSTTHFLLHELLKKGIVVKTSKHRMQHFAAIPPQHLEQYLCNREVEIQQQQSRLQDVLPGLLAISNPHAARPTMEFCEGIDGARYVVEQTLNADDTLLRAFLSVPDMAGFLGEDFWADYSERRFKKGYTLHALRTKEKDEQALAHINKQPFYLTKKEEKREVRYIDDALSFPMTMYMFDHSLAIISSKEEGFAILLKSNEMADMQKKLFEVLWKVAT